MATKKQSNLAALKASKERELPQPVKDLIAYRRQVEDHRVNLIVEDMLEGRETPVGFGWTPKQLAKLKERAKVATAERIGANKEEIEKGLIQLLQEEDDACDPMYP